MLRIYNSLSRKIEDFKPIHPSSLQVGMYTCGPTVYDFAHIGNFRTYTTADVLKRALEYNGYEVDYIMNLTDVGHLTGDNLGDADFGEDRMEKSAKKEGKTAWEVAAFYTEAFLKDFEKLNLEKPRLFAKATDHVQEQIDLVRKLEDKGFTYQTSDGIYFDTSKFPQYGALSNLDQIKEGARVEKNPEKRHPRDFALWKFSYPNGKNRNEILKPASQRGEQVQDDKGGARPAFAKGFGEARQMEWKSPWGVGFPGWHIECSAMSMKYLGESFDIHVGGIDLRETHHPNEIAQSEAATGELFVKYWVHSAFMLVTGERMSKSLGNNYKLYDLEKDGYDPLALRYLYLQTHYRQEMNFSFASLDGAQSALHRLREAIVKFDLSQVEDTKGLADFEERFLHAVNDDLNLPQALGIMWEMMKESDGLSKVKSLLKFDRILGLDLENAHIYLQKEKTVSVPEDVQILIKERITLRKAGQYAKADHIRNRILKLGYELVDTKKGTEVRKA